MYYDNDHHLLSLNRLLNHILVLVIPMIKILRIHLFASLKNAIQYIIGSIRGYEAKQKKKIRSSNYIVYDDASILSFSKNNSNLESKN